MICTFPDLYSDELLYSGCARYQDLMGFRSNNNVIENLFGNKNAVAISDFPIHLDAFINNIPLDSLYTSDYIITHHTMLPYYEVFITSQKSQQIRNIMRSGKGGNMIQLLLGNPSRQIKPKVYFYYCPLCVLNDRKLLGETYWHRLHQVTGLYICPTHKIRLVESKARSKNLVNYYSFISAESSIPNISKYDIDLAKESDSFQLLYGIDVSWLLSRDLQVIPLETISDKYLVALINNGMASTNNTLKRDKLFEEFSDYYSKGFSNQLFPKIDRSFFTKFFHMHRSQHPIFHLLLIHFLGMNLEQFIQLPGEINLYGKPPWACYNPVCESDLKYSINTIEILKRPDRGIITIGVIRCYCGFTYYLTKRFHSSKDIRRCDIHIIDFGGLWYEKFEQLWNDPRQSLYKISKELGVVKTVLIKQAEIRELDLSRINARAISRKSKMTDNIDRRKLRRIPTEIYRDTWTSLRQAHPDSGIKELREIVPNTYNWLIHNDNYWLKQNLPQHLANLPPKIKIDWAARDTKIADDVVRAAEEIKQKTEKPVRVTTNRIARLLGLSSIIPRNLDKLPRTAEALSTIVETNESFAVRRIFWVATRFRYERIIPCKDKFMRRASIANTDNPVIKALAEEVYTMLNNGDAELVEVEEGQT